MINWLRKSLFDAPSQFDNPVFQEASCYTKVFRPLRHVHCFALKGYHVVTSLIVCLFFSGTPFNISREVSSVIINSFNSMKLCRFFTNMRKEFFERFYPRFKHFYASFSVVFKIGIIRVCTSLFHQRPRVVFSALTHVVCSVRGYLPFSEIISRYKHFFFETSATLGVPGCETSTSNYCGIPTGTNTTPLSFPVFIDSMIFDNSKTTKGLPGKIDQFRHDVTSWLKVSGWKRMLEDWQPGPAFRGRPYPAINDYTF